MAEHSFEEDLAPLLQGLRQDMQANVRIKEGPLINCLGMTGTGQGLTGNSRSGHGEANYGNDKNGRHGGRADRTLRDFFASGSSFTE